MLTHNYKTKRPDLIAGIEQNGWNCSYYILKKLFLLRSTISTHTVHTVSRNRHDRGVFKLCDLWWSCATHKKPIISETGPRFQFFFFFTSLSPARRDVINVGSIGTVIIECAAEAQLRLYTCSRCTTWRCRWNTPRFIRYHFYIFFSIVHSLIPF